MTGGFDLAQPAAERLLARAEWRNGWRTLVAAGFGVGVTYPLLLMTAGLFVLPMEADLGWSRSELSLGPIAALVAGALNPVAGWIISRFGARRTALAGVALLGIAYLALAIAPAERAYIYGLVVFAAASGTLTNPIAYSRGVTTWFRLRLGTALGLMMSGVSLAGLVLIVPISWVIAHHGWRAGYAALGLIALSAVPIVFSWFRERPAGESASSASLPLFSRDLGSPPAQALRSRQFWLLVAALCCAAWPVGGFLSQLVPILASRGIGSMEAAWLASCFALAIGAGRIAAGFLLDRLPPSWVTAACLGLPAVGALLLGRPTLADAGLWLPFLAVCLIGFAQGAEGDFASFYTARLFGVQSYPILFGIQAALISISLAVGGWSFAYVYDLQHDYRFVARAAAAMFLMSACLILCVKLPRLSPQQGP